MLSKLSTGSKEQTFDTILSLYTKQGRSIVSFLYFANVMHWRLLEESMKDERKETRVLYMEALEEADFLLPDGIALQMFYKYSYKPQAASHKLYNLNGTDFIPYVLDRLVEQGKKLHIAIYSVYDPKIGKTQEEGKKVVSYIKNRRDIDDIYLQQSLYSQRGDSFDREGYSDSLEQFEGDIHICLVCTGTPHQEIRTQEYKEFFKKNKILAFNAGGLVDYRSGFERRAPDRVVKARVLETPRRILQHPRKNFKKLWWMFGVVRYIFRKVIAYIS